MTRRIFLLNGLAILAVVLNHTTSWGITAMFWWTDAYRPVAVPNFDQIDSLSFYLLLAVRKLAVFAVPAFLFVSGFFVAYASRGSQTKLSWKFVRTRITNLLIPYLIWSVVIFGLDALQGIVHTPTEYLIKLVYSGASGGYSFVPLLCQLYLVAPLLVPFAQDHWRPLLAVTAILQLAVIVQPYLALALGAEAPAFRVMQLAAPDWLFIRSGFFFAFGIVFGFHRKELYSWFTRYKWGLLAGLLVTGAVGVLEPLVFFYASGGRQLTFPHTVVTSLYATSFLLCYLAFDKVRIPFSKTLHKLAGKTYGLYLLHDMAMQFIARLTRQLVPWLLSQPLLFMPLVFAFGLAMPLLFMAAVLKSPARRAYRYLFG